MLSVKAQRFAEVSTTAAMDASAAVVRVTASTTSHNVQLAGDAVYKVSLRNADSTVHCYFAAGVTNAVTAAEPADTAHQGDARAATGGGAIRGDEIDRIYVDAATPWIAYVLSAGFAGTYELVFVRVA